MSRKITFFVLALLLFVSLTQAARPEPDFSRKSQVEGAHEEVNSSNQVEEGCDGVGEEECLMRRTLVAHTDYIYTQGKKN